MAPLTDFQAEFVFTFSSGSLSTDSRFKISLFCGVLRELHKRSFPPAYDRPISGINLLNSEAD